MDKWQVYIDIKQLLNQGFKVSKIAKKLGISRTTVYSYLEKDPDEMAIWIAANKQRKKKLDQYKSLLLTWLKEHPDLSAAQIHDWLKERYPDFIIGESTVRAYVKSLREEYQKLISLISYWFAYEVEKFKGGQAYKVDHHIYKILDVE